MAFPQLIGYSTDEACLYNRCPQEHEQANHQATPSKRGVLHNSTGLYYY